MSKGWLAPGAVAALLVLGTALYLLRGPAQTPTGAAEAEPSTGEPKSDAVSKYPTLALRISVRATELMNIDTRISSDTVRLMSGGWQFTVRRPFNQQLFASQSMDLNDLLFIVPASIRTASLQVGTADGPSGLIALRLAK